MTYRFTFYKIPFSETGVEYPLPTVGNPTESLEKYKTIEQITDAQFREKQNQISIAFAGSRFSDSNYLRVGTIKKDSAPIDEDLNVSYYWIRDVEFLGSEFRTDGPVLITIAPDDIMTEFFTNQNSTIKGRIAQTTKRVEINGNYVPRRPVSDIIYERGSQVIPTVKPSFKQSYLRHCQNTSDQYLVVLAITTEKSDMYLLAINITNKDGYTLNFGMQVASTAFAIVYNVSDRLNINVTKCYILPKSIIGFTSASSKIIYFTNFQGKEDTVRGYALSAIDPLSIFYPFENENIPKNLGPEDKLYFLTPNGIYEYEGDPTQNPPFGVLAFAPEDSEGADSPTILGILNGSIFDITEDFSASFATNEEAINRNQFSSLHALQQISTAIGSIGGIVGGVASGNYFGAVQSLAGGVSAIAGNEAAIKKPASVKSSDNAYNIIQEIEGFGYYVRYADDTTKANANYFGYYIETAPYIEISANNIEEGFYRFSECDAVNLSGGGQDAQATIEALFTRGVRFKSL